MKAFLKKYALPLSALILGSVHIALQEGEYVTTSVVKLDSLEEQQLLQSPLLPAQQDENALVEEIVSSKAFLMTLDNQHNVGEHLNTVSAPFKNYRTHSNNDELFEVMSSYVIATYNEDKGITTIETSAYEPEFSATMNERVITLLKDSIQQQNMEKTESQLEPTRQQIAKQTKEVEYAQAKLEGFEKAHELSNPEPILEGHVISLAEVQKQIHSQEVEIERLLTYLHPAEHEVVLAKQQLAALKQSAHKIGSAALNDDRVKKLMMTHENLMIDYNTAREGLTQLKIKLQTLEQDLIRKHKHITVLNKPVLASQTEKPDRLRAFIILLIGCAFFYALESVITRRKA